MLLNPVSENKKSITLQPVQEFSMKTSSVVFIEKVSKKAIFEGNSMNFRVQLHAEDITEN